MERWKSARDEIRSDPDLGFRVDERSWRVNAKAVVGKLTWIADRVPRDSAAHERLLFLSRRLAGGKEAAEWAGELMRDFERVDARARRLRNTLVHGGPVVERGADETVPFVETVAADALNISIEGRLDGVDLIDFFLDRRADAQAILSELKSGADPTNALWPAPSES